MALSGLFSSKILTENSQVYSISNIATADTMSHSYFMEALNFASEINNDLLITNKVFYKSVLESAGNAYAIHEGFESFFDTIKSIIKKIIAFIEKLYDKFVTALMRFFKSDSYIKKHKKDLAKFSSEDEFTYDGYEFTIDPNVPETEVLKEFANSIEKSNITSSMSKDVTQLKTAYSNLIGELEGTFYDRVRGKVLGEDTAIDESSYADELFKKFRNDDNSKGELTITSTEVNESLRRFEGHAELLKVTKNNKTKLANAYKEIEKSFNSAIGKIEDGKFRVKFGSEEFEAGKDAIETIDLWCKAKATQIQKIANIHNLAFSAKLDAIKDCYNQDKNIIYKALYKVQGK